MGRVSIVRSDGLRVAVTDANLQPETGCEDGTDPNRGEDPFHQQ